MSYLYWHSSILRSTPASCQIKSSLSFAPAWGPHHLNIRLWSLNAWKLPHLYINILILGNYTIIRCFVWDSLVYLSLFSQVQVYPRITRTFWLLLRHISSTRSRWIISPYTCLHLNEQLNEQIDRYVQYMWSLATQKWDYFTCHIF